MNPLFVGCVIQIEAEGVEVLLTCPEMTVEYHGPA